jgi:hypothetical protein
MRRPATSAIPIGQHAPTEVLPDQPHQLNRRYRHLDLFRKRGNAHRVGWIGAIE